MRRLHWKIGLLLGLLSGDRAWTGPLFTAIDITDRCNLRCRCCPCHSDLNPPRAENLRMGGDISPSLVDGLLKDLSRLGTGLVIFEGRGEPLLHPGVFGMIRSAKRLGFETMLITNGTLLDDQKIRSILASGLDTLKVSLWAVRPETYRVNYPHEDPSLLDTVRGNLLKVSRAKRERASSRPHTVLCHPLNRANYREIGAVVDFARDTGCEGIYFSPLNTSRGRFSRDALGPHEVDAVSRELEDIARRPGHLPVAVNAAETRIRYQIGEDVWQKVPCYIGWFSARIKTDGSVFPCNTCHLPMGNLKKHSFGEVWNGGAYRSFRRGAMWPDGGARLSETCDCGFCCDVIANLKVHRLFRWLRPLSRGKRVSRAQDET